MKETLKNILGAVLTAGTWLLIGVVLCSFVVVAGVCSGLAWRAFQLGWRLVQ